MSGPPSSSGLGCLVLSQKTGVRVPVGVLVSLRHPTRNRSESRKPRFLRGFLLAERILARILCDNFRWALDISKALRHHRFPTPNAMSFPAPARDPGNRSISPFSRRRFRAPTAHEHERRFHLSERSRGRTRSCPDPIWKSLELTSPSPEIHSKLFRSTSWSATLLPLVRHPFGCLPDRAGR
jgi:hypothetical protein